MRSTSDLAFRRHHLTRRVARLEQRLARLQLLVRKIQNWRLSLGAGLALGLGFSAARPEFHLGLPVFVLFLLGFMPLWWRTRKVARHIMLLSRLREFYLRVERRRHGQAPAFHSSLLGENMALAKDLGIVGSPSLIGLIDETLTASAQDLLLTRLFEVATIDEICARQRQTKALRSELWFFKKLRAQEQNQNAFRLATTDLRHRLTKPFYARSLRPWVTLLFLAWSGFVLCLMFAPSSAAIALTIFAAGNFLLLSRIGAIFGKSIALTADLENLVPIFSAVAGRAKVRPMLAQICPTITRNGPERGLKRLERSLAVVGVETNPLAYLFVNALAPWSLVGLLMAEHSRKQLARDFEQN